MEFKAVDRYINKIVAKLTESPVTLLDEEAVDWVAHVAFLYRIAKASKQGILDRNWQEFSRFQDLTQALRGAVVRRLPEAARWRIDTHVFATDDLHAFSGDAGRVVITEGLARMMTDDEVSAILAHEFSHSVLQHRLKAHSADHCLENELGSVPLWFRKKVRRGVERTLMQPLCRKFELEADALSLHILADSGIDPTAALTVMRKLADLEQEPDIKQQFSRDVDHPPPAHRLAMLEKRFRNPYWPIRRIAKK
jgi:Zn-dependent protease with chaperone function